MADLPRPPIVAVMGHIDHGKSSLLDYIRKTRVVETEAGGITQHLGAYTVGVTLPSGEQRTITFLDTPGHAAFHSIRQRGALAADIVILVVSAEEGGKPQTKEAFEAARAAGIPVIVAFSKIDRPKADVERAKYSLLEQGIYLEGLGGDIPYVPISSKTGEGIPELLELVLLVADMQELSADPAAPPSGVVVEAHHDEKRGISATLLVKEGTLRPGTFVVAGGAWAPVRRLELPTGGEQEAAGPSFPAVVRGFSSLPRVGSPFRVFSEKQAAVALAREEAEALAREREALLHQQADSGEEASEEGGLQLMPLILKADTMGSLEALLSEIPSLATPRYIPRVIHSGVGPITEGDVLRAAACDPSAILLGFNVGVESLAEEVARREGVPLAVHQVIYDALDWLARTLESHTPKRKVRRHIGSFTVLVHFSSKQSEHLIGGKVTKGMVRKGALFLKPPPEEQQEEEREPMSGSILSLQRNKRDVEEVLQPNEFGAMVRFPAVPQKGERFEVFVEEWE